jgi:hypothetical protein
MVLKQRWNQGRNDIQTANLRKRLVLSAYSKQQCMKELLEIGKELEKWSKSDTYDPSDRTLVKHYQSILWLLRKTYTDISHGKDPINILTTLENFLPIGEEHDRIDSMIEKVRSSPWLSLDEMYS